MGEKITYKDLIIDPAQIIATTEVTVLDNYLEEIQTGTSAEFTENTESVKLCLRELAARRRNELLSRLRRRSLVTWLLVVAGGVGFLVWSGFAWRQSYLRKVEYVDTLRCYVEISNSAGTVTTFPAIFANESVPIKQEITRKERVRRIEKLEKTCRKSASETGLPINLSKIRVSDF